MANSGSVRRIRAVSNPHRTGSEIFSNQLCPIDSIGLDRHTFKIIILGRGFAGLAR